jgi:hypothetical protein
MFFHSQCSYLELAGHIKVLGGPYVAREPDVAQACSIPIRCKSIGGKSCSKMYYKFDPKLHFIKFVLSPFHLFSSNVHPPSNIFNTFVSYVLVVRDRGSISPTFYEQLLLEQGSISSTI